MLTLQFIPHMSLADLNSDQRIKKLLDVVKSDKIVLLEGRLKEEEEADLIKKTMESIDEKFTGIELGVIYPQERAKFQQWLAKLLLGARQGFTVIGPANIIKEIKKDPNKIQLYTKEPPKPKKKK